MELRRARLFRWDRQKGGAITIALPFKRAMILLRSRYLVTAAASGGTATGVGNDDAGRTFETGSQLAVGRHLALIRHEFCHVAQLQQWGFVRYWWRHLLARVRTRNLLAANSDVEAPCYEAQRQAAREFDNA